MNTEEATKKVFPTIAKLQDAAAAIRRGELVHLHELADVLDLAAKDLSLSIDANMHLLAQLMLGVMAPPQPQPRKARMVELTKDHYLAYCRHRGRNDAPDRVQVIKALRDGLKAVGASKVIGIEEGPDLLKHLQATDESLNDWASGYADFAMGE